MQTNSSQTICLQEWTESFMTNVVSISGKEQSIPAFGLHTNFDFQYRVSIYKATDDEDNAIHLRAKASIRWGSTSKESVVCLCQACVHNDPNHRTNVCETLASLNHVFYQYLPDVSGVATPRTNLSLRPFCIMNSAMKFTVFP